MLLFSSIFKHRYPVDCFYEGLYFNVIITSLEFFSELKSYEFFNLFFNWHSSCNQAVN